MLGKKLVDQRNVDLGSMGKQKISRLKVSWITSQGNQKKRGNPSVEYLPAR